MHEHTHTHINRKTDRKVEKRERYKTVEASRVGSNTTYVTFSMTCTLLADSPPPPCIMRSVSRVSGFELISDGEFPNYVIKAKVSRPIFSASPIASSPLFISPPLSSLSKQYFPFLPLSFFSPFHPFLLFSLLSPVPFLSLVGLPPLPLPLLFLFLFRV